MIKIFKLSNEFFFDIIFFTVYYIILNKLEDYEKTIVLHAGHRRDETTTSVAVPIYKLHHINLIIQIMHQNYFLELAIFIQEL